MKKLYLNYKYATDQHRTNRYSPKLAFERMFSFYFKVGAIKIRWNIIWLTNESIYY